MWLAGGAEPREGAGKEGPLQLVLFLFSFFFLTSAAPTCTHLNVGEKTVVARDIHTGCAPKDAGSVPCAPRPPPLPIPAAEYHAVPGRGVPPVRTWHPGGFHIHPAESSSLPEKAAFG